MSRCSLFTVHPSAYVDTPATTMGGELSFFFSQQYKLQLCGLVFFFLYVFARCRVNCRRRVVGFLFHFLLFLLFFVSFQKPAGWRAGWRAGWAGWLDGLAGLDKAFMFTKEKKKKETFSLSHPTTAL